MSLRKLQAAAFLVASMPPCPPRLMEVSSEQMDAIRRDATIAMRGIELSGITLVVKDKISLPTGAQSEPDSLTKAESLALKSSLGKRT